MCNRTAFNRNMMAAKFGKHGEHPLKKAFKENFRPGFTNQPPVNVREKDDKYELHLFAAGFEKSDFVIALTDNTLRISMKTKEESETNWKRQEHAPSGFERQFELNEKVDKTAISATYENGVLIVQLPKKEGFETERMEIAVG